MEQSQQTISQVDRALERTIGKFPAVKGETIFTDIHLRASQESGELVSFNDDGEEINRAVISAWINNTEEAFFPQITALLRKRLNKMSAKIAEMGIGKPFSFVLEDSEGDNSAELYVADDDTVILGGDIMTGLSKELDAFFNELMKDT